MRSRHAAGAFHGSAPRTSTAACVGGAEAFEDLDRGRLAGSVGAEEGEDLAAADLEVDPAHRLVDRRSACAGRGP